MTKLINLNQEVTMDRYVCAACGKDLYTAIVEPSNTIEEAIAGSAGYLCSACVLLFPPPVIESWRKQVHADIALESGMNLYGVVDRIHGQYIHIGRHWIHISKIRYTFDIIDAQEERR